MRWLRQWLAFHAHQRDVDALARMSDHLLEDIGLRRDQLHALRLQPLEIERRPRAPIGRARPAGFRPSLKGCG